MSEDTGDLERALAPEHFDCQFEAQAGSAVLHGLWAAAWGADYPREVAPFSGCSWSLLGRAVGALRLQPGDTLVDLGCGDGGPGLWLARATGARLVGVDWSAAAVQLARRRAPEWVAAGHYEFHVGTFGATGLAAGSADAVVSVDAIPLAPDLGEALAEVRRLLRPGGRLVFSASEPAQRPGEGFSPWTASLAEASFEVHARDELPGASQAWERLYRLCERHEHDLRGDIGDAATDNLLNEARTVGAELEHLRWYVLTPRPES